MKFVFVNEFLLQKLERAASVFIEISLIYATVNQNEGESVSSTVPNAGSINGSIAPLRWAFYLVNLLGIAAR